MFGHESIDIEYLRDAEDTNTKTSSGPATIGGYWPNRNTCKIFDANGDFINNTSLSNGSGNKQVNEIKCLERYESRPNYHIDDCGVEGKSPPTVAQCRSKLFKNSWFGDPNIYSYYRGMHTLNLQEGKYRIEIAGGSGGTPKYDPSVGTKRFIVGKGAILRGTRTLSSGEYKIVIGQNGKGNGSGNSANGGGSGGGGSFFWMNGAQQPLLVAGGGGGAGIMNQPLTGNGGNGSLTPDGTMGTIIRQYSSADPMDQHDVGDFGGKNGGDGGMSSGTKRGGYLAKGWNSLKSGFTFTGATRSGHSKEAGFGGGGVSKDHGGGGGGGYSGGGVFDYQSTVSSAQGRPGTMYTRAIGGGGGGSRFDTNFRDREDSSTLGYNTGGGYIKIWGPY